MKDKSLNCTIILYLLLIAYGLSSLSIALEALFPLQDNPVPVEEIITDSGNKIEIYNV